MTRLVAIKHVLWRMQIIRSLHQEFAMTDLGPLNYFLGISVTHDSLGLFQSQKKYALKILKRSHMANYNPSRTPIDTESNWAVIVCLYMHDPRESHFSALKRILRAEAEYRGVANDVAETCWSRNLLRELCTYLSSATLVYSNNFIAFMQSGNRLTKKETTMTEPNEYIFVTRKNFISNDNEGRMIEKFFVKIQGAFLVKIRDNTFNGTIGENAFEHVNNFLEVVGQIKINEDHKWYDEMVDGELKEDGRATWDGSDGELVRVGSMTYFQDRKAKVKESWGDATRGL
uniref:Ribonuclease H-like domain-containing protein n=1 Tax=Tanacetum cinerariifolium TaxID=118510 RepID=A0A6L2KV74_TANCI|nr:ribonuclease H-like domain-containing protein [Tanacetum cinerariifolium]